VDLHGGSLITCCQHRSSSTEQQLSLCRIEAGSTNTIQRKSDTRVGSSVQITVYHPAFFTHSLQCAQLAPHVKPHTPPSSRKPMEDMLQHYHHSYKQLLLACSHNDHLNSAAPNRRICLFPTHLH
jgi:hypothetical protein